MRAPSKDERDSYLDQLRNGMRRGAAAEAVGLRRQPMLEWIEVNPEFELACVKAEAEALEHVEEALYHAAISGNVTACKIWLELRGRPTGMQLAVGEEDSDDDLAELRELTG